MIKELRNTTSSRVSAALVQARREMGSPASNMVLTFVVMTDEENFQDALDACCDAGREHPSRILLTVQTTSAEDTLQARLHIGEGFPGEIIVLHLSGAVRDHAASAILPLLLPDSPVVIWWPGDAPVRPDADPVGALADRRITDSMAAPTPLRALRELAHNRGPGDTDLTWTRLTPWRALLAASLDQFPATVVAATVEGSPDSATAELLAAWLESRLGVKVTRHSTPGSGIATVCLTTGSGDIAITRQNELTATYKIPGQPERPVALRQPDITQLLIEELRRLDADDVFQAASRMLLTRARRNQEPKE